jgi:glutamyl-tRNA synthetase
MSVRVRFAPSPTGRLHVGALRDALFKHLLAKKTGGANVLRIEDTDRARYSEAAEREFIEALNWVGIHFDEGPHVGGPHAPYRQSERMAAGVYAREIAKLLAAGHAYKAFDTPEELEAMRLAQQAAKGPVGYFDGPWRDATPDQVAQAEAEDKPCVVRLRIPRGRTIAIEDLIRGRIEWSSDDVDDPVLIKADGMPTYHCAAMVDDHLMEITHIIRGDEWISSAPKHAVLFDAFGWERPVFVHCPVIRGKDGKKLSKRHGATSVLDYRSMGYLPDALNNFIALIGWSPGDDREVMGPDELVAAFDLGGLQPSPGLFDPEKLRWMNGHYIRQMAPEDLLGAILHLAGMHSTREFWDTYQPEPGEPPACAGDPAGALRRLDLLVAAACTDRPYALQAVRLAQERVHTLVDFGDVCEFLFLDLPADDPNAVAKWLTVGHAAEFFRFFLDRTAGMASLPVAISEGLVRVYAAQRGFDKLGPVVHPLRVALTGRTAGPGLYELIEALGPGRVRRRLEARLES